jgi:RNA polymerase sigma-70 factor (ECF subfamily)
MQAGNGAESQRAAPKVTGLRPGSPNPSVGALIIEDRSFPHLLVQLRAGNDRAAGEVVQRFSRRLLALARRRQHRWARRTEDPEDVVQSVFQSFFACLREGRFRLISWNDLWRLLKAITFHKCADQLDYARARRRHVQRAVSLLSPGVSPDEMWELAGREPSPLEALLLAETVDQLVGAFAVEDRPIVELSVQGYSAVEISSRLGRAVRSVRRVRQRIKKRLWHMQAADAKSSGYSPRPSTFCQ